MTTQTTVYTFDMALIDAASELAEGMLDIAKLPAAERAEAIRGHMTKQVELAHTKVDAHDKTLNDARMKREQGEKKVKDAITEGFEAMWKGKPEFARDILALAKADPTIKALTVQVTVHREEKAGEGDKPATEVISLGSPVTMLGTRIPARTKASGNGNGGGGKSQTLTVNGKEYASAAAASKEVLNDERGANREAIIKKLTTAGHKVS